MPNWNEILNEIKAAPNSFDQVRRKYIAEVSHHTERNSIIYYSGWLNHQDTATAISDEDTEGFMNAIHELDRTKGLNLVLHTEGGDYHATMNLIRYLREMFDDNIVTFVPQIAMSGGTILACAGQRIVMGKHSNLGPIDPHKGGASAANVKEEFDKIVAGTWPEPIMGALLSKYPASFINEMEKLLVLSKQEFTTLLREGMFKSDIANAEEKIENIVRSLSDPQITKAHSRHLSKENCRNFGLEIENLEDDRLLQDIVLSIHHACMLTFSGAGRVLKIIENQEGKAFIKISHVAVQQMPIMEQFIHAEVEES